MRTEYQNRYFVDLGGVRLPDNGYRIRQGYLTTGAGKRAFLKDGHLLVTLLGERDTNRPAFRVPLTPKGRDKLAEIADGTEGNIEIGRGFEVRVRIRDRFGKSNQQDAALALICGSGNKRRKTKAKLDLKQAEAILANGPIVGDLIVKTRYDLTSRIKELDKRNSNIKEAVVDVYAGKHKGLGLLVVEFANNRDMNHLVVPKWVTHQVRGNDYNNSQLADGSRSRFRGLT